ncbi:hypothetical protein NX059_003293 [Plenodomus lindquistii]|nr:hypothetical protein NX059_003293 [Plenodomus lindquistii]
MLIAKASGGTISTWLLLYDMVLRPSHCKEIRHHSQRFCNPSTAKLNHVDRFLLPTVVHDTRWAYTPSTGPVFVATVPTLYNTKPISKNTKPHVSYHDPSPFPTFPKTAKSCIHSNKRPHSFPQEDVCATHLNMLLNDF